MVVVLRKTTDVGALNPVQSRTPLPKRHVMVQVLEHRCDTLFLPRFVRLPPPRSREFGQAPASFFVSLEALVATHARADHLSIVTDRPKNKLLARLSAEHFERLKPDLRTVPLTVKQVLQTRSTPLEYIYFLNGGVASITTVMQNGEMVEIATVGDEGLVGMDAYYGDGERPSEVMMQVPDTSAERMTVAAFKEHIAPNGALIECVRRYAQALIALIMQSTACLAPMPSTNGAPDGS